MKRRPFNRTAAAPPWRLRTAVALIVATAIFVAPASAFAVSFSAPATAKSSTVRTAADPWDGAGGAPGDPWGLNGTPRYALGQPIVGDYTRSGANGSQAVVRVTHEPNGTYRGVMFQEWNGSGSYTSTSCNIPAGETVWWDLVPDATQPPKSTFDWRYYVGGADEPMGYKVYEVGGVPWMDCYWKQRNPVFTLGVGYPGMAVSIGFASLAQSWKKVDQGGPGVVAQPGSGKPGGRFALSFTADEPDGWASFYVQVYQRGNLLGGAIYEVEVQSGMPTVYTATGTLGKNENASLSWCVTAYDAAGNKSSDCAKLATGASEVASGKRGVPFAPYRQDALKVGRGNRVRLRIACFTGGMLSSLANSRAAATATCGGRRSDALRVVAGRVVLLNTRLPRITAGYNRAGTFTLSRSARRLLRKKREVAATVHIYQDEGLRGRTHYRYGTVVRR